MNRTDPDENKTASLVFPHQLFEKNPCIQLHRTVYIVEEYLFFRQYAFHKQKIAFHRATMKFYEDFLQKNGYNVVYMDSPDTLADVRKLIPALAEQGTREVHFCEVSDDWLERRIKRGCEKHQMACVEYESPLFINTRKEISEYFKSRKRYFQTEFYKSQRIKRKILVNENNQPDGGKWTFDTENRLRYPQGKPVPEVISLPDNEFDKEAKTYTLKHYPGNYGQMLFKYPTTYAEANAWFTDFLENRFYEFGKYEDAIVAGENILNHSVLSPLLNVGLLHPAEVIARAVEYAGTHSVPINSVEGFVRQILGWREFIRAVYFLKGRSQRTKNFWKFSRKLPKSFYTASTGILPVDITIKKLLETGYNHHIERLMILGNIMVLCEIDPDEVYQWFMEMYIDAYDWVMVPNVYGMSQYADGGIMTTKPYISGSNYLKKMGNYSPGEWEKIWDGLFWSFMHRHRSFFLGNPRLRMLIQSFDRMDESKQKMHLENAEWFMKEIADSLQDEQ